jgi:hypothetical protein
VICSSCGRGKPWRHPLVHAPSEARRMPPPARPHTSNRDQDDQDKSQRPYVGDARSALKRRRREDSSRSRVTDWSALKNVTPDGGTKGRGPPSLGESLATATPRAPEGAPAPDQVETRASLIAFSGHATTHFPHAWQAEARGVYAVLRPWAILLSFPIMPSSAKSWSSIRRTSKTLNGQTRTQSDFPSHRERSMTGANSPGWDRHSVVVAAMNGLDDGTRGSVLGAFPFLHGPCSRIRGREPRGLNALDDEGPIEVYSPAQIDARGRRDATHP